MNMLAKFRIGLLSVVAAGAFAGSAYGQTPDKLSIAIIAPNTNFAPVFVAKAAGAFEKQNLDVTILENTGANTLPLIASGTADLTLYAFPNPLIMAVRGQPSTVILAGLRDSGTSLLGNKNIKSLEDLAARGDNCRIATTPPGTQGYGYSVQFTKLPKLGLQKCRVEAAASNSVAVARLVSGQIDAVGLPLPYTSTIIEEVGGHMLLSPADSDFRERLGVPDFISGIYFGTTERLASKRDQIVRFVKAMLATGNLLVPENIPQLVKYLKEFKSFSSVETAKLEASLKFVLPYMGPGMVFPDSKNADPNSIEAQPGYISKKVWDESIDQISKWGIPGFSPDAPTNAYESRVDLSYLKSALEK